MIALALLLTAGAAAPPGVACLPDAQTEEVHGVKAICSLYRFDRGELARAGHCRLPPRLDPKALKASGWK